MKFTRDNIRNAVLFAALLLCLTIGAIAQTPDYKKIWTTVGSAGTVDETDTAKVFFNKSVVQMGTPLIIQGIAEQATPENNPAPAARENAVFPFPQETAVVRYNVTPVDGLFAFSPDGDAPSVQMTLRYLDVGAQVVAKLIEVDLATGAETVRLTFDSNTFPAANGYHVDSVGDCNPRWRFDFVKKAYYVEATLSRSALFAGTASGISIIKVGYGPCFL